MIDKKKIPKIEKDYKEGCTYKQIAKKYKVTYNEVTYLIKKEKWKRESNLSVTHLGNKNAVGNSGGPGAKEGNKNAVTTGEYETILLDALSDDEKQLYQQCDIADKKEELKKQYKILTIREFRIMKKSKELQDKNKEMTIEYITKNQGEDSTGTTTHATNTINISQKLDDSLTRIQEAKRKCIDSLHKIETDDRKLEIELIRLEREAAKDGASENDDVKDDSFIKALEDSAESTWDDYEQETESDPGTTTEEN